MAPFAFLGPSYDATLRDIYTGGEAETLVETPDVSRAAFGASLFGGQRLLDLVSRYVDADIVAALAREHQAGRRLYVVTTNVDSKRGVVWNIGAIAASGRPDSIDLIRKVLAASASVPLAFAPQLINVTADGHSFQEMHADGNVTTAVFTLPLKYLAGQKATRLSGGAMYVVMNTVIEPEFSVVQRSTLPIVTSSLNTLTTQKAEEDLAAAYAYTRSNHVDFNLTSIDPAIDESGLKSFDTAYMAPALRRRRTDRNERGLLAQDAYSGPDPGLGQGPGGRQAQRREGGAGLSSARCFDVHGGCDRLEIASAHGGAATSPR